MQYDFRSVYHLFCATGFVLSQQTCSTMLYKNYQYLPFKICGLSMDAEELNKLGQNLIINYPNPFVNSTTITYKTMAGIR